MQFQRQITVLLLFFLILFLFIFPNQDNISFSILKGIAIGGLVMVFISFAFPSLYKMNKEEIVANQKDIESNSFSTVVKSHYQRLITQVVDLISVVNSNYATGIYMIDREVHGYTKQHSSNADFIEFVEEGNGIISEILSHKKSTIIKKNKKNEGWKEILGEKIWRGSETFLGFPILYLGKMVGCILVYTDHFSSIRKEDQRVIEKLGEIITHGMADLEQMESVMVDNYFNSRVTNLFEQLEVKSDEAELFESIRGICRAFFQYDKLTIILSDADKKNGNIKLVDGLHDDADEGQDFELQNCLHGLAINENKIIHSNTWVDELPEINRFYPNDRDSFNFMSVLSIPLQVNNDSIGAVTLERLKSKKYSDTDSRLLELLCGTVSNILNWQKEYERVNLTAMQDGLTGLLNHKTFLERFDEEVNRASRFKHMLGLVVFDLDKFKLINDNHGHLYGDYVLQEVSNIISENVRAIDVVGRYGGEEFALLLVNTDIKECLPLAERIVKSIANKTFLKGGIAANITISAGMAGFPTHAEQVRELISMADKAMYQTKSNGGNGITIAKNE